MTVRLRRLVKEQSVPQSKKEINNRRQKRLAQNSDNPLEISGFDIDGVITAGIFPGPKDVIITGRSFQMANETNEMLRKKKINNPVYFNPELRKDNTRASSGKWKAKMIKSIPKIKKFFEDDPIQAEIIEHETDVELIYVISKQEK